MDRTRDISLHFTEKGSGTPLIESDEVKGQETGRRCESGISGRTCKEKEK